MYNYEDMTMEELQMQLKFCNENGMDAGPVLARINQLKFEGELAEKTEERLHSEISFNIEGLDFTNLPVDVIKLIEKVVLIDRKKILADSEKEVLTLLTSAQEAARAAEEREIQLSRENVGLQDRLSECESVGIERSLEIDRLKMLLGDAESKRDAAALAIEDTERELSNAKKEIKRLKEVIDEYQVAKVYGEREAQKVITINSEPTDAPTIQALIDSIAKRNAQTYELAKQEAANSYIKVTLKEKVNSNTMRVILAATGEEKYINWIDQGKYVEVSQEDADAERARFLSEQTQASVEESVPSNPALVEIEEPTFPLPNDAEGLEGVQSEADSVDHGTVGEDVDTVGPQSLEERVSALERHVFGQSKGAA